MPEPVSQRTTCTSSYSPTVYGGFRRRMPVTREDCFESPTHGLAHIPKEMTASIIVGKKGVVATIIQSSLEIKDGDKYLSFCPNFSLSSNTLPHSGSSHSFQIL